MVKILDEIMADLPKEKITAIEFEAANIIIYTKSSDFLFNGRSLIKNIVSKYKKRIELRADNILLKSEEETKKEIKAIIPEVLVSDFKFDVSRSILTLEVDNVGAAVGKEGINLKQIQKKVMWSIIIRRIPPLRSKTVDAMRAVEYQESEYRRKFLNKVGKRIYEGWRKKKIRGWARVTILGSGNQIGRSAIYLQTNESRILFDCGIDTSIPLGDPDEFPFFDSPDFKIEDIDAVVISHAHLDHCGLLPYLFRVGYRGPVYTTEPTRDIMALSQIDFIKISSQSSAKQLYKTEDVKEMIKHVITLNFNEVTDITSDIRLTLYNSGHILGSAFCHVNIGNGMHNFMYTGDFNFSYKQRLLNKADTVFPRLETLMIENTSTGPGDYSMPREEAEEKFLKIIVDHYVKKGKILIPVFGIGRSQEMLLTIENLIKQERLPKDIKIYADGMVGEVNAIHTTYLEFLNRNLKSRIISKDNPFLNENFIQISGPKERQEILRKNETAVILATSGMMVGGSSVEYFKNLAEDEKNAIIFVGYQANGTLGRKIKDGEKEILFNNTGMQEDKIKVNLQVYSMKGAFSAHSDLGLTKKFLASLSVKPKKIILNHGDVNKIRYFAEVSKKIIKDAKIYTPENLDSIRLL